LLPLLSEILVNYSECVNLTHKRYGNVLLTHYLLLSLGLSVVWAQKRNLEILQDICCLS